MTAQPGVPNASLMLPPVVTVASGMPCAATMMWRLVPVLARPTGDGPVVVVDGAAALKAGEPFVLRVNLAR